MRLNVELLANIDSDKVYSRQWQNKQRKGHTSRSEANIYHLPSSRPPLFLISHQLTTGTKIMGKILLFGRCFKCAVQLDVWIRHSGLFDRSSLKREAPSTFKNTGSSQIFRGGNTFFSYVGCSVKPHFWQNFIPCSVPFFQLFPEEEQGYRTGWRNSLLGINSGAP